MEVPEPIQERLYIVSPKGEELLVPKDKENNLEAIKAVVKYLALPAIMDFVTN